MRSLFEPRLVSDVFGDPGLYVDFNFLGVCPLRLLVTMSPVLKESGVACEPARWRTAAAMSVLVAGGAGIISDRRDLLRQVAGELGVALPRPTPVPP